MPDPSAASLPRDRPDTPVALDDALWQDTFAELKKVARARLHAAGHPAACNTTMLVNESWIKLSARAAQQAGAAQAGLHFPTRSHFFAYASRAMRSILVDLLREQAAQRRGGGAGGAQWVTLDTGIADSVAAPEDEPLQVDRALHALEVLEPRLAQVVELRYYAGMTDAEVADVLGVTDRTVRRDWDKARALLRTLLAG